jgi:glycosyltransferase involved in cell wall biosynthesis
VSKDIAAEVRRHRIVNDQKVIVIENGIDAARFEGATTNSTTLRHALGIPLPAPVVGTVGRLSPVKRQDVLIRAFGRMKKVTPEPHLLLVGDGPLLGELRSLAADLGLSERVHFAGYQSEPERYLGLLSIFALSSDSEGMPVAALEAWAAGIPVVASSVGGLPELVEEGKTGLLVPPRDETALAGAIDQLLADPCRARRMGGAGQKQVETRHSLSRMARAYHDLYLDIQNG